MRPGADGSATLTFRRPKTDTDTTAYLSPATAAALAASRPPNVVAGDRVAREEIPTIMQAGGWKNERMVARYTARERAGRGAVARFYAAMG